MMQRLSGWMPSSMRGEQIPSDLVVSLGVKELEDDSLIFSLCQDHRLRLWSLKVSCCVTPSVRTPDPLTLMSCDVCRSRLVCWRPTCWTTCRPAGA